MREPWTPRALAPADLPAALAAWAHAHPEGAPCAGDPVLSSAARDCCDTRVVMHEGEPIALGVARTWGRVSQVHGLIVAEPFRRRGVGGVLLESLLSEMARRDAAVVGVEVDSGGAAALTFLARHGFRPMHLSFVLERAIEPEAAVEAEPASDAEADPEGAAAREPAGAPEIELLSGPDAVEGLGSIRALSASVDADFDPTRWIEERLLGSQAEVALLPGDGSQPAGFAVLPALAGDTLLVSMAVATDGPPHAGLIRMMAGIEALARRRGAARVQVAAPSRYWDATLALLGRGYRPRASYLRLTRQGAPERADTRRCYLTSWR